jgi:hypothetical protein
MWLPPIAFLLLAHAGFAEGSDTQREKMLDRIEARLVLPPGAYPLKGYSRAYAWSAGRTKVRGMFSHGPDRRYWVPEAELPLVMDGGCDYVEIVFDIRVDKVEHAACNGEA